MAENIDTIVNCDANGDIGPGNDPYAGGAAYAPIVVGAQASGPNLAKNRNGDVVRNTKNALEVIRKDPGLARKVRFDRFRRSLMLMGQLPSLLPTSNADQETAFPRPFTDDDMARICAYVGKKYGADNFGGILEKALVTVAHDDSYHPIKDFFDELPTWDGNDRLGTFFHYVLGAADTKLNAECGRLLGHAIVKRVYQPGCKFDVVIVLVGPQGIGKSHSCMQLAPSPEYYDGDLGDIGNKDAVLKLDNALIAEMSELAGMTRKNSTLEQAKAFIATAVDKIRKPYGHLPEPHPRHCVIVGTTNSRTFLTDVTGNRRFPPVEVGATTPTRAQTWSDDEWAEYRDQFYAQALADYLADPDMRLVLPEYVAAELETAQANNETEDVRIGRIERWLNEFTQPGQACITCIAQICRYGLGMMPSEYEGARNRTNSNQVAEILTAKLGCRKVGRQSFKEFGQQVAYEYTRPMPPAPAIASQDDDA